jgi:cysteine sulfinate desulfinase/cysteine desulfurase-like protein
VALVTFDYIASCPGALMPIHAMARECKARGVPVLLDGAHVLGQITLDCHALEVSGVTYFMVGLYKLRIQLTRSLCDILVSKFAASNSTCTATSWRTRTSGCSRPREARCCG